MTGNFKIGVIILAAGASKRLGHPKQLVEFKGRTLLQHTIDVANSFEFDSRVLVLGAGANVIMDKTNPRNFELIINEAWEEGISSSIRQGVNALLRGKNKPDQILILLADQPFVSVENIGQLIKLQLERDVAASFSEYAGDVGVPAIFSKEIFPQLLALQGDQGAKKLIYNKDFGFATMRFENGNFDVDTAKDIELLRQLEKE